MVLLLSLIASDEVYHQGARSDVADSLLAPVICDSVPAVVRVRYGVRSVAAS